MSTRPRRGRSSATTSSMPRASGTAQYAVPFDGRTRGNRLVPAPSVLRGGIHRARELGRAHRSQRADGGRWAHPLVSRAEHGRVGGRPRHRLGGGAGAPRRRSRPLRQLDGRRSRVRSSHRPPGGRHVRRGGVRRGFCYGRRAVVLQRRLDRLAVGRSAGLLDESQRQLDGRRGQKHDGSGYGVLRTAPAGTGR